MFLEQVAADVPSFASIIIASAMKDCLSLVYCLKPRHVKEGREWLVHTVSGKTTGDYHKTFAPGHSKSYS